MLGQTEMIFALFIPLIGLALAIFMVVLFYRLVRAVEKIADKLGDK